MWIIIACSLLLFISNFGVGGVVGSAVSGFLFGVFGSIAYILPIILILGCFFITSNKGNILAILKFIAAIIFALFICLLISLVTTKGNIPPIEAFAYSKTHKFSGGILGGFLAFYLSQAFGIVGTYIIDIIVLIISVVLFTGKSAIKGVQKGGQKVYESAKDNNEKYKEYRKIKEAEKKRRIDNKVYGVSTDTKLWIPMNHLKI
jgi:S-DNA-T family DNA segregation ATPase FtsK/SpoIIIE